MNTYCGYQIKIRMRRDVAKYTFLYTFTFTFLHVYEVYILY